MPTGGRHRCHAASPRKASCGIALEVGDDALVTHNLSPHHPQGFADPGKQIMQIGVRLLSLARESPYIAEENGNVALFGHQYCLSRASIQGLDNGGREELA